MSSLAARIEAAIGAAVAEIPGDDRVVTANEKDLWSQFVACVLASAVTDRSARAAHGRLAHEGLLDPAAIEDLDSYERALANVLGSDGEERYRFPNSRARQIASSWSRAYAAPGRGLLPFLQQPDSELALRQALVDGFPGLGMKAASLFLIRAGYAVDLVPLDTHILSYLRVRGVACEKPSLATPSVYLRLERTFVDLTRQWNRPASVVDLAVWVTMSELRRMGPSG